MRNIRPQSGPFRERPYYKPEDIERICATELRSVDLYPSSPEPIRIERFIEKRFKVTPAYEELPDGVLGWTRFGARGVEAVVVSRRLAESASAVSERRVSTTLAHEAGHALLHAHLFVLAAGQSSLFPTGEDVEGTRILCRDESVSVGQTPGYSGRWWEYQANQAMAALLIPSRLVELCLAPVLSPGGALGVLALEASRREHAVRLLADAFSVNPIVARLRLSAIYPDVRGAQLTL